MQSCDLTKASSGGFLDGVKGTIRNPRWDIPDDYNNGESTCLMMDVESDSGDLIEGKLWSAGSIEHFQPSEDGMDLLSDRPIHEKAGAMMFLASLSGEGYEVGELNGNIGALDGVRVLFSEIAVGTYKDRSTGEEKERKVAIVAQMLESKKSGSGKKATAKKAPPKKAAVKKAPPKKSTRAGKSAAKKSAPPEDDGDILVSVVMEVLAENDGSISRKHLPRPVFEKLSTLVEEGVIDQATADEGTDSVWDEEWLGNLDGATYDADEGILTINE